MHKVTTQKRPDLKHQYGYNHIDYFLDGKFVASSMIQPQYDTTYFRFLNEAQSDWNKKCVYSGMVNPKKAIEWIKKNADTLLIQRLVKLPTPAPNMKEEINA